MYIYLINHQEEGKIEGTLVCKVSVKGDLIKGVPEVKIQNETYLEFEKLI
jgi:hypothetical protein